MLRRLLLVTLFASTAGCGTNPPPVIEAKVIPTAKQDDGELKPPPKPAASDAAGADLLKEVLAAHTGGHPEKLDALRTCTFTRKGQADLPGGKVSSEWKMSLLWPDRYRLRTSTTAGGTTTVITWGVNPDGGWVQLGDAGSKDIVATGVVQNVRSQMSEDSVALLFALADPKLVVTRAAEFDTADETSLHVWTPGVEYARLGVSKKTKLLARFTYVGREADSPTTSYQITKEVTFTDFTDAGGVKLGSKLTVRAQGQVKGEWAELTVDPKKPDEKEFAVK